MPPTWLTILAWVYLGVCFVCAGVISYDILFAGRRQPMGVMNFVFPITALYFGPAALALYWRWGRVGAPPATARSPKTGASRGPQAIRAELKRIAERAGSPAHGLGTAQTHADVALCLEPLSERDVMAIGILYAELAEAVRGVVDRVIDASASLLNLGIDRIHIVDPDVRIPHLVHDLPVRHKALG